MKKILSAIGKKNIIIISGILLIGIAVYLNLTLQIGEPNIPDGYSNSNSMNNDAYYDYDYDFDDNDAKVFGQAALVDNMNYDPEDMGVGMGDMGMNDADIQSNNNIAEENYFAVAVVSRRRARDESLELLNNIIDSAETMPDVMNKALQEIAVIAGEIEKEANIETIIKAKGFIDCVAVLNGENAHIIVKTEGLMANEVAQIKEIVYEQAGVIPGNVKIVEKT